jgi:magnesium transporter
MTVEVDENTANSLYGASADLVKTICEAIDSDQLEQASVLLTPLHAADVADVLQNVSTENRRKLVELLKADFDPEILGHLDDSVKDEVIEMIGSKELAAALSDLESDDALSVIEDLDQTRQREILRAISAEERAILEEVLTYPEDSAGRLMQREVAAVPSFWTVGEVVKYLGQSQEVPETFYDIFVVNPKHQPLGFVPVSRLFKEEKETSIDQVMETELHKIPVTMDKEEVARLFYHYGLVSAPVIDTGSRLVGMVTVDDVVDVIEEEATEDIMHLAGISDSDFHAPVAATFIMRFRWLFVTLINTVLASLVISQFQATIEKLVALAVLMPIATAMAGNSGMQVVTVTVRAIATRDLRPGNMFRSFSKELSVGFLNGCLFALILGVVSAFLFKNWGLSMVLASALIFNMAWAAFAGILLPITIHKMGMDPALSAGPILTTTTDVIGFAVFLGLAAMFLI